MIMMVIIRYISRVLVWILTILVVLGSLGKLLKPVCLLTSILYLESSTIFAIGAHFAIVSLLVSLKNLLDSYLFPPTYRN